MCFVLKRLISMAQKIELLCFMQGLKSAILAIFQNGLGCPVSAALKNPSQEFKNSFSFGCRLIPRKTKVKLESAHFSKVQSGKITM